jgi:hypothetical protein
MPKNIVRSKSDEKLWNKAKKVAVNKYRGKVKWKVVNSIYQEMKRK